MSYQLEIRHINYFLAVAEDLHFRKAAERLYISQPGLSRQIKQLEDQIGIKLFERNNRKVMLTSAGEFLKKELSIHLNSLYQTLDHAKDIHSGFNGRLRFGYVGSAMQELIPDLLIRFKKDYPNVSFNLKEMDNQQQIKSLLAKNIDIGFMRLDRVPRTLDILPVLKEPFCLVLPKEHSINISNFKNLKQLKNESFILFDESYSPSYYEKVMQLFDYSGFSPIISHNTIHASSIYKLVENGFGISIVPRSLQYGYNLNVKFIELKNIPQRAILSAVWDKNNRNPILKNLFKFLNKE